MILLIAVGSIASQEGLAAEDRPIRELGVEKIVKLGREIYDQDQLAWKATDILIEKIGERGMKKEGVVGWITVKRDGTNVVRFLGMSGKQLQALYDIVFGFGAQPLLERTTNKALGDDEIAQFNARQLAMKNIGEACSDRYNSVAIKDSDGKWLVWALAATTDDDLILIGGHYRFTISADGSKIIYNEPLSRSCLRFSRKEIIKGGKGGKLASMVLGHLVSLTPVETHIFANLNYGILMFVGTPDGRAWRLEEGSMHAVEMDAAGLDGMSARGIAAVNERCTFITTKKSEKPARFYTHELTLQVIRPTEEDGAFSAEAPKGHEIVDVICGRLDIVPAPNDYKVVLAGYTLSIKDVGAGHPDRFGRLEESNGQFAYKIIKGPPLTKDLEDRVAKRLQAFQSATKESH